MEITMTEIGKYEDGFCKQSTPELKHKDLTAVRHIMFGFNNVWIEYKSNPRKMKNNQECAMI